jgi:phage tail protein X
MARYNNIPKTRTDSGTRLYKTVKYPTIPRGFNDIYVVTTEGDRYDRLAQQYYKDSSLWWVISSANATLSQNSLFPPIGIQIRIPSDLEAILEAYNDLNK